jgi:PPOX class probable F420-dependent enzyme
MMSTERVAQLEREKCISLTTFRRDGSPVATPVWFVPDGDRLIVWTFADRGKVKRIRTNPQVTVAPCTYRGTPTGDRFAATAQLLPASEGQRVQALLNKKYGAMKRLYDAVNAMQGLIHRRRSLPVYLEVTAVAGGSPMLMQEMAARP